MLGLFLLRLLLYWVLNVMVVILSVGVDNRTVGNHSGTTWTVLNLQPYNVYRLEVTLQLTGGLTAATSSVIDTQTLEAGECMCGVQLPCHFSIL